MTESKQFDDVARHIRALLNFIAFTRKPDKFNQTMWCRELGVSESAMSMWLRGERRPNVDEALKMCALYGVSLDFIYRGHFDMLPHKMVKFLSE